MHVTRRDEAMDGLHRKVEDLKAIRPPSILLIRRAPQGLSAPRGRLGIFELLSILLQGLTLP